MTGDLADQQVSEETVKGIDCSLHQAAVQSGQRSESDPLSTNRANVPATVNLLDSFRKANVRRLVYAASSSAYGDTEVLPQDRTNASKSIFALCVTEVGGRTLLQAVS